MFLITSIFDLLFFLANLNYYAIWKEVDCFGIEILEFAIVALNGCTAKYLTKECGMKNAIFICLQLCFNMTFIVIHYLITENCFNKWQAVSILPLTSPQCLMFVFAKCIGWTFAAVGMMVYHYGTRCFRYTPLALSQV